MKHGAASQGRRQLSQVHNSMDGGQDLLNDLISVTDGVNEVPNLMEIEVAKGPGAVIMN
jgi:hypothetical protein